MCLSPMDAVNKLKVQHISDDIPWITWPTLNNIIYDVSLKGMHTFKLKKREGSEGLIWL